jgi:hypothetical protein
MTVREHIEADQHVRDRRRKREAKAAAKAAAAPHCATCGGTRIVVLTDARELNIADPICRETDEFPRGPEQLPAAIEPDPQTDGGLPFTRADEAQCNAIADYYDEESKKNAL